MKTLRHTLTTLSLALTTLLTPALTTGCQDDPLFSAPGYDGEGTATRTEVTNPGALRKEGNYWVATERVPLVGVGRMVDDIPGNLVSLFSSKDSNLDELFDDNLDNYTTLQSNVLGADIAASAGICVKDLYHTYAGGQTVGFVVKFGNSSLLELDVLKTLWIATSLDGDPNAENNEGWEVMGATSGSETNVLDLALLSPQGGDGVQTIQVTPTKPFNKIKLGFGGISAEVLSNLQIYYAFVGDNPAIRITTDNFPDVNASADGLWSLAVLVPITGGMLQNDVNKMTDPAYTADTDGPKYAIVAAEPSVTFQMPDNPTIPAGAEIGFKTNSGSVLGLGLFGETTMQFTYTDGNQDEIVLDGGVLGLSLLGGGNSLLSAIPKQDKTVKEFTITFGGLTVDVGGITVNYAYYRNPVQIDPSTYFAIAPRVTSYNSTYRLPVPTNDGSYQYTFESGPANAEVSTMEIGGNTYPCLTGMTVDGEYKIRAIYTDPDSKKQISYDMTIVRELGDVPSCHTPITTASYPKATAGATPNDGCLLCLLEGVENPTDGVDATHTASNLTDNNTNNYAGYVGGVGVISHSGIVTIDAGEVIPAGEKRVGFVMQTTNDLLSLGALKFFNIVLRDADGNVVVNGATAENSTVGLGLLGGSNGGKIRYSIETDKAFRYIDLYSSGVASIDLDYLRIFYAFWEDTSSEACKEELKGFVPGEAGSNLMSVNQNNARLWYQKTGSASAVSAGVYLGNLGNLIDDDRTSGAVINSLLDVGESGLTVGVRFDELTDGQSVGILLRSVTGVADLNLLTSIKPEITVYSGANVGTGESATKVSLKNAYEGNDLNAGLLDLNLIANNDYIFMEVMPDGKFDGIEITLSQGLLAALKDYQICGVYSRPAMGTTPPDESEPEHIDISLATQDVCEGDPITVNAQLNTGSPTPADGIYYLKYKGTKMTEASTIQVKIINGKLQPTDGKALNEHITTADVYALRLYETEDATQMISSAALTLTVHPTETTWLGNSTDWNNWDNWSAGVPWHCTNVIIPGNTASSTRSGETPANYPMLEANGDYHANNIYFGSGAQLVNSFYLNYNQAWVDISLDEGRYYLLSAPLKDTYSGDWFIPEVVDNEASGYFPTLNETSYPEQRLTPRIYQRLWSMAAPVVENSSQATGDNIYVSPDETRWTPPYNSVAQAYGLGLNFSLMAGVKDGTGAYTFRFPKKHGTYHYYGLDGQQTGQTESITRTINGPGGRFIYEEGTGRQDGDITVTLTEPQEGNVYLGGNPFLAHVDIAQLMGQNGISEIKVYDGNTNNSLILVDGELVSTTGNTLKYLKPLEAFFVVYKDEASGDKELTFAPGMFSQGTVAFTRSAAPALPSAALRLTASRDGHEAHALLRIADDASADVVPGEDTQLLVEGEARPAVAVYTVAGGRALDIQQRPGGPATIPLGFYLPGGGKADIRLTLDFTDPQWTDWFLVDQRTGQRQRITHTTLTLHDVESGSGQYVLMKN